VVDFVSSASFCIDILLFQAFKPLLQLQQNLKIKTAKTVAELLYIIRCMYIIMHFVASCSQSRGNFSDDEYLLRHQSFAQTTSVTNDVAESLCCRRICCSLYAVQSLRPML